MLMKRLIWAALLLAGFMVAVPVTVSQEGGQVVPTLVPPTLVPTQPSAMIDLVIA